MLHPRKALVTPVLFARVAGLVGEEGTTLCVSYRYYGSVFGAGMQVEKKKMAIPKGCHFHLFSMSGSNESADSLLNWRSMHEIGPRLLPQKERETDRDYYAYDYPRITIEHKPSSINSSPPLILFYIDGG